MLEKAKSIIAIQMAIDCMIFNLDLTDKINEESTRNIIKTVIETVIIENNLQAIEEYLKMISLAQKKLIELDIKTKL